MRVMHYQEYNRCRFPAGTLIRIFVVYYPWYYIVTFTYIYGESFVHKVCLHSCRTLSYLLIGRFYNILHAYRQERCIQSVHTGSQDYTRQKQYT